MKYSLVFVFTLLLLSCSSLRGPLDYSKFKLTAEEKEKIALKAIFTSELDGNEDPVNSVTEFNLKGSVKVILYISWFELSTTKKHYVKVKWYSPDGNIYEQNDYLFKPHEPTHYSWHYITFEDYLAPKGNYKVHIYMDNEMIKEMPLVLK